jgi:hypothetical protein
LLPPSSAQRRGAGWASGESRRAAPWRAPPAAPQRRAHLALRDLERFTPAFGGLRDRERSLMADALPLSVLGLERLC